MGERDPEMVVVSPEGSDQLHPVFVWALWGHENDGLETVRPDSDWPDRKKRDEFS